MEIWKDINGWEDIYQISNLGRYRSKGRYTVFSYKVGDVFLKSKILSPNRVKGYLIATLYNKKNGVERRERWPLHRLVAIHFIPNPKNKPTVNHRNGVKDDNRVDNLEWATDSEQQLHAVLIGLRDNCLGENSNLSKLKTEDVIKIRSLYSTGNFFQKQIAEMFGIREETCYRIIKRKIWKHI